MTKNTETEPLICSICQGAAVPIYTFICQGDIDAQGTWLRGHNAEPINSGRCCSDCNSTVVIPARLVAIYRATNKS